MRANAAGLGPSHLQTTLAKVRFGDFLHSREEYSLAREELVGAYKLLPDSQLVRGVRLRVALAIADCCDAMNDPEEADAWRSERRELSK